MRPNNLGKMSTQEQLLAEIEAFLRNRRMAETTFGRVAVNDGKFVARLRLGGNMTLATVAKVRAYIKAAPPIAEEGADGSVAAA
jgi:hypothetical protein